MNELFRTDYKDVDGIMESFKTNEIYVWCAVNKQTGEVELEDVMQFDDEIYRLNDEWEWQKFYLNTRPNDAKWISVEDELPNEDEPVLGFEPHCLENRDKGVGYIDPSYDFVKDNTKRDGTYWVTHWMPLPDPPQDNHKQSENIDASKIKGGE